MAGAASAAGHGSKLNLLNFAEQKIKMLHLTWFAFFLTFVIWFAHAPLLVHIKEALALTDT